MKVGGEKDVLARSPALHAAWILGASCWKRAESAHTQATSVPSQPVEAMAPRAGWSYKDVVLEDCWSRVAVKRPTAQAGRAVICARLGVAGARREAVVMMLGFMFGFVVDVRCARELG